MKFISVGLITLFLIGCGGSGSSSSSSNNSGLSNTSDSLKIPAVCPIVEDTINLKHDESCTLTESSANAYSLAAGDLICDDGTLDYAGSKFNSGVNGLSFNELNFVCGEDESV